MKTNPFDVDIEVDNPEMWEWLHLEWVQELIQTVFDEAVETGTIMRLERDRDEE